MTINHKLSLQFVINKWRAVYSGLAGRVYPLDIPDPQELSARDLANSFDGMCLEEEAGGIFVGPRSESVFLDEG